MILGDEKMTIYVCSGLMFVLFVGVIIGLERLRIKGGEG
jgi:hypothetical protein